MGDTRDGEEVQRAARSILEGVAPECEKELEALWSRYNPRFSLVEDAGRDGLFVMQGGLYRDVWFNHRAMRAFWLASFIAWEGYRAISDSASDDAIDLGTFSGLIGVFDQVLTAPDLNTVAFPQNIPEPGIYPDAELHAHERATAELATFTVGWAFLHEIRHLQHQQDGTSAGIDASKAQCHAEEFSCDGFATDFLLNSIDAYAEREKVSSILVRQKREMGIYFALFAMTLISRDKWNESESHPAMQERIDRVVRQLRTSRGNGPRVSDVVAHAAFAALWMQYPAAPGPVWLP